MCMEDYKMGKATMGELVPIVVGLASALAVPQNINRRSLLLGPPDVGVITYSTDNPAVLGLGLNVAAGQDAIMLCQDEWGSLVKQVWYAISTVAVSNACFAYSHFEGTPAP